MIPNVKIITFATVFSFVSFQILTITKNINAKESQHLSLPDNHLPFYNAQTNIEKTSRPDQICWGHESNCDSKNSFSANFTKCKPSSPDTEKSRQMFFNEADFGYVKQRSEDLLNICSSSEQDSSKSSLKCSNQLQFCVGQNIRIDLRDIERKSDGSLRYNMDVLKHGQITGKCRVNKELLEKNQDFMSPLQSWAPELRNLVEQTKNDKCDITIESPTYIMKIDASVNMYHHFCDFFNLYASQHLNATINFPNYNSQQFSTDNQIIIWENLPYRSAFASAFEAFTSHPIWNLDTLAGKQVCFKDVMFPLLPRMIYGLYYNTPFSREGESCSGSGLFRAFSEHVAFRMGMSPPLPNVRKIRVTIMHRLTQHRQILNIDELVSILKENGSYEVNVAQFTHGRPTFREQMKVIREETDILVGIHGAGLTHLLFLPNWAAVFELYHCDDPGCYQDLARLRGVKHVAWTNESLVYPFESDGENTNKEIRSRPANSKFRNYKFDKYEFLRKIKEAEEHVRSHPDFDPSNAISQTNQKHVKESFHNDRNVDNDIESFKTQDEL